MTIDLPSGDHDWGTTTSPGWPSNRRLAEPMPDADFSKIPSVPNPSPWCPRKAIRDESGDQIGDVSSDKSVVSRDLIWRPKSNVQISRVVDPSDCVNASNFADGASSN